jgi:hypothetical protein
MKKLLISLATVAALATIGLNAANIKANFADPETWNGKFVPEEKVCSNYNMEAGSTPEIILRNIPKGTKNIILTFTDETFEGMRNGGHGVLSYTLEDDTSSVIIPTVKGETFDLPENFTSVKAHRGTNFGKNAGAYLAPCSGGKGNSYSVRIQALDKNDVILDTTSLTLGTY